MFAQSWILLLFVGFGQGAVFPTCSYFGILTLMNQVFTTYEMPLGMPPDITQNIKVSTMPGSLSSSSSANILYVVMLKDAKMAVVMNNKGEVVNRLPAGTFTSKSQQPKLDPPAISQVPLSPSSQGAESAGSVDLSSAVASTFSKSESTGIISSKPGSQAPADTKISRALQSVGTSTSLSAEQVQVESAIATSSKIKQTAASSSVIAPASSSSAEKAKGSATTSTAAKQITEPFPELGTVMGTSAVVSAGDHGGSTVPLLQFISAIPNEMASSGKALQSAQASTVSVSLDSAANSKSLMSSQKTQSGTIGIPVNAEWKQNSHTLKDVYAPVQTMAATGTNSAFAFPKSIISSGHKETAANVAGNLASANQKVYQDGLHFKDARNMPAAKMGVAQESAVFSRREVMGNPPFKAISGGGSSIDARQSSQFNAANNLVGIPQSSTTSHGTQSGLIGKTVYKELAPWNQNPFDWKMFMTDLTAAGKAYSAQAPASSSGFETEAINNPLTSKVSSGLETAAPATGMARNMPTTNSRLFQDGIVFNGAGSMAGADRGLFRDVVTFNGGSMAAADTRVFQDGMAFNNAGNMVIGNRGTFQDGASFTGTDTGLRKETIKLDINGARGINPAILNIAASRRGVMPADPNVIGLPAQTIPQNKVIPSANENIYSQQVLAGTLMESVAAATKGTSVANGRKGDISTRRGTKASTLGTGTNASGSYAAAATSSGIVNPKRAASGTTLSPAEAMEAAESAAEAAAEAAEAAGLPPPATGAQSASSSQTSATSSGKLAAACVLSGGTAAATARVSAPGKGAAGQNAAEAESRIVGTSAGTLANSATVLKAKSVATSANQVVVNNAGNAEPSETAMSAADVAAAEAAENAEAGMTAVAGKQLALAAEPSTAIKPTATQGAEPAEPAEPGTASASSGAASSSSAQA